MQRSIELHYVMGVVIDLTARADTMRSPPFWNWRGDRFGIRWWWRSGRQREGGHPHDQNGDGARVCIYRRSLLGSVLVLRYRMLTSSLPAKIKGLANDR